MKLILKLTTVIALTAILGGCASAPISVDESQQTSDVTVKPAKGNQGITVNKIPFEEIADKNLPQSIKSKIETLKIQSGYIYEEKDGYFYITIFSGEKPTGGYSIKVISIEDNEGKTNIMVEETSPKDSDIVTQVITYPYVVIKVTGITPNIKIFNKDGSISNFPLLKGNN